MSSLIRDNWPEGNRGSVGAFLSEHIKTGCHLSIVSAYFTIHAYHYLKNRLDSVEELRFLFGEPNFTLDASKTFRTSEIEKDAITLDKSIEQKHIARECADWIKEKVQIRSMVKPNFLHGKMYHIQQQSGVTKAISGSSNFTASGLGFGNRPNMELNLIVDSDSQREDLLEWFNHLWNQLDSRPDLVRDVKAEVLKYLEQLYKDTPPEFVYLKTLYHIFEDYLQDQGASGLLNEKTGFYESEVWQKLYLFQKDGVKGAINKLIRHGGCILADSVGLGKTFEALAVIKYFELLNYRVLVLCPKKLSENWTIYQAHKGSTLNPFKKDRFHYSVMYHTDLGRTSGMTQADGADLATFNWGNYDLVVIDESHNFRNNTVGRYDAEGRLTRSRYQRLMDDIINAGAKTKVLLLSATPVNNTLKDIRNQIYFMTGGSDTAFEKIGIKHIGRTLSAAQKQFTQWADASNSKRTLKELLEKLDSSFFKLLDELTIARSRRHIQNFYDISTIGKFPTRLKPISVYAEMDVKHRFRSYDAINREISAYKLSLFNPSAYLLDEYKSLYGERIDTHQTANFSQAKREHFLIGMMKVGFLKRLESSVQSFELSMNRTIEKIIKLEEKIKVYQRNPVPTTVDSHDMTVDLPDDEEAAALDEASLVGGKKKFNLAHLDLNQWLRDMQEDKDKLISLHDSAAAITPDRDAKLQELKRLIAGKSKNPLNPSNRKVIVFTAFADTAQYLYENLHAWANTELNMHSALVSGGVGNNQTTFKPARYKNQSDFNAILTNFSPRAKHRNQLPAMPQEGEIDLLIATDCISEGQNLQDCDYLINYDIHWNPVRIIQRFGRIDRLGSVNEQIQLVNFWPTQDLDQYINLKTRVEARMALVDVTATGEDNLLSNDQIEELIEQDLKYRDKQLKRLQQEVLDLEDLSEGGVSLTDFTLDDFRIELMRFIEKSKKQLAEAPLGLYAVVPSPTGSHARLRNNGQLSITGNDVIQPGVLFCLRQKTEDIQTEEYKQLNPLHPYYLVYLYDDGSARYSYVNARQILEVWRLLCQGETTAYQTLCDVFSEQTQKGADMSQYSGLLRRAIDLNFKRTQQKAALQLKANSNAFILPEIPVAGPEENHDTTQTFELITWLVIL
jgi:superfamily II DNA or RNA helicase